MTEPDRFWRLVDVRGPNDCWEWQGTRRSGYGRVRRQGRLQPATHIALQIVGRPLGPGENALHRCDNPPSRTLSPWDPANRWSGFTQAGRGAGMTHDDGFDDTAEERRCDRCGRTLDDWPCNDDGSDYVPDSDYWRERYAEWKTPAAMTGAADRLEGALG